MINKITKFMLNIWQFPQFLLGKLMITILKKKIIEVREKGKSSIYLLREFNGNGISLGSIIILDKKIYQLEKNIKHEYGHSKQSLMLGPLYLLVVGLPSITMNLLTRIDLLKAKNYYKRWPETWADKLGKVNRV